jgi:hypothetical protein
MAVNEIVLPTDVYGEAVKMIPDDASADEDAANGYKSVTFSEKNTGKMPQLLRTPPMERSRSLSARRRVRLVRKTRSEEKEKW